MLLNSENRSAVFLTAELPLFYLLTIKIYKMKRLTLTLIAKKEKSQALQFLEKHNLPTIDIDDSVELYGYYDHQKLLATIGLQAYNTEGLLRSVCVDIALQKEGFGSKILKTFEAKLHEKGIQNLYLLTTTAEDFFQKNNYIVIARDIVPEVIRQTAEFKGVCPASAIVMKKSL
jgi:amino-acid N-acetyltransferase